jgi:AsmA protein
LADPRAGTGLALDLDAAIPDLAPLGKLAGQGLPALTDIALKAKITDAQGGLRKGAHVTGLVLTSPHADLSGEAGVTLDQPISVTARLASRKIDLDLLRAAFPAPPDPSPPAATERAERRASAERVIPDTRLPFETLHLARADIRLDVDTLRFEASDYTALVAHLTLQDGRLRLDPVRATSPEGAGEATLDIDAGPTPPTMRLTLRAPGLRLRPLLEQFGIRPVAAGQIELRADLRGAGDTPRAIAASLDGSVGVAMAGGSLDIRALSGALGKIGRELPVLDLLGRGGGMAELRCLALRFDATDGIARSRALVFNSSLISADGGGTINLRDETLDLRVLPQGRVAATTFRVPVTVKGRFNAPKFDVDASGAADANAERLAGIVIGGALGLTPPSGAEPREANPCPGALTLARFGAEPAAVAAGEHRATPPPAQRTPRQQPPRQSNNPADLLRNLFR